MTQPTTTTTIETIDELITAANETADEASALLAELEQA